MPPKKLLKLNCFWISNDHENPNNNILSVSILKHETVGDLKIVIKNDAQDRIDACHLHLSKVSIPMVNLLRKRIQEDLDKKQSLWN